MKVIFQHSTPFCLAHGGVQTVAVNLMRELAALGVEVEPVRWWDEDQQANVLHYIGRPALCSEVKLAQEKGLRVVMTEFLDQTSSRTRAQLWRQRVSIRLAQRLLPGMIARFSWNVYRELDAMVYAVPHEWEVAKFLFGAHPQRGHIVPHGLDSAALTALRRPLPEEDYLVSLATITPRKNTLLLAEAAQRAQVPLVFLGKPYSPEEDYFQRFHSLVDGRWVRYPGFVTENEKQQILGRARGFVLCSQFESGCIAVYEAAAAGLPMLLSDRPWASAVYGHFPRIQLTRIESVAAVAPRLAEFYAQAHRLPHQTFPVHSWREIARQYLNIYQELLQPGGQETSR